MAAAASNNSSVGVVSSAHMRVSSRRRVGAVQTAQTLKLGGARQSSVRPLRALEKSKDEEKTSASGLVTSTEVQALEDIKTEETPSAAPAKAKEPAAAAEPAEPAAAELGAQFAALKQKRAGGDPDNDNMFVGAFEEIGQIEWPTAGAAVNTSGIVIGMASHSSTFQLGFKYSYKYNLSVFWWDESAGGSLTERLRLNCKVN